MCAFKSTEPCKIDIQYTCHPINLNNIHIQLSILTNGYKSVKTNKLQNTGHLIWASEKLNEWINILSWRYYTKY